MHTRATEPPLKPKWKSRRVRSGNGFKVGPWLVNDAQALQGWASDNADNEAGRYAAGHSMIATRHA